MGKLEGKIAIVTGASSGIGAETAREFAREGAKVVLAARSQDKLKEVQKSIEDLGGEALVVPADCSKDEDNKRVVDAAMAKYGALHVSFINAGVGSFEGFMNATEEDIDKLMNVNFKGVVFGLKHQDIRQVPICMCVLGFRNSMLVTKLPAMSKSGDKGSVIVDSSGAGTRVSVVNTGASLYSASKAAVNMMVKYGAVQGAPMNVRVNGVAPGVVDTPMASGGGSEKMMELASQGHLIPKVIQPIDIARFVTYLASDDAYVMTGAIYPVDCGAELKW